MVNILQPNFGENISGKISEASGHNIQSSVKSTRQGLFMQDIKIDDNKT